MNQLITYNNANEGDTSRRYTGFPLNSTLVSSYTADTIRSIINHAITGKPYTTAVWIRISSVGIHISAQDPKIARTRIPVFIPIALAHDIFMQPSINNVICIVYDEVKSNMKGVLLYVVYPTDTHLLREDFRIAKQASFSKGIENQIIVDKNLTENKRLFSPTSQHVNDIYLNDKINRQQSPRRILFVRDNETGANRDFIPTSTVPALPQLSYTPFKALLIESSHHHHHHHHHRRQPMYDIPYSSSKPDSNMYNTISHSFRARSNGIPRVGHNINNNNNPIEDDNITKQFLKQLVDDMQAMKLEMNKIRLASSPMGTTKGRSDSARVNIKELRNDIDAIRARMTIPTKFSKQ
ncbi:unnamed protein product [Rotaria socialis]|uniref:Uncharacterized protein n=1 Tax=Rotaria socialis TaxID=392032 RepID=A0A821KFL9_9BILA|nr:unnamed protein product [Rotaria socialis]